MATTFGKRNEMPYKTSGGGILERIHLHVVVPYIVLLAIAIVVGYFLISFLSAPSLRFDEYGYPLEYAVAITGYRDKVQTEPEGKSAIVEIGLPARLALEEAEATVVCAMRDLYQRRPDLDVIVVYVFYEYDFGVDIYRSLGQGVWGPGGKQSPVIHKRRKDNYAISFYWNTKLPTIEERRVQESLQQGLAQKKQKPPSS